MAPHIVVACTAGQGCNARDLVQPAGHLCAGRAAGHADCPAAGVVPALCASAHGHRAAAGLLPRPAPHPVRLREAAGKLLPSFFISTLSQEF